MSTTRAVLLATGLVLAASLSATAQTTAPQTAAPPTHPATGAADAGSTGPTMPPTHPATANGTAANPTVNGYKDSQPSPDDPKRGSARTHSQPAPDGSDTQRNPTSTDSMTRDNMPKHPAAPKQ